MYVEFDVVKRLGDFSLEANGEFRPGVTCIVGPNGAGKTTLMKVVAGLLKPDRGYVRQVGVGSVVYIGDFYVPPDATGLDVVLAGRTRLAKRPVSKKDEEAAVKYAELFEAGDFLKRRWGTLSGGQRQFLVLAAALSAEADLTLLDEPLAPLYPEKRPWALSILRQNSKILVLSTHNLEIAQCCDYVYQLEGGRVVWRGPGASFKPVIDVSCGGKVIK
ncbi:MAG: ATP-binding cassette domain-containing protein [Pyrobaculum sp.]